MRTFIAIEVNRDIREAVAALGQRLRRAGIRASWTKPDRMHLTLRFVGEIAPEAATQLGDTLAERYASMAPFRLAVRGTGAFPNLRKPAVIWAGVAPADGPLEEAHRIAEDAARAVGVPPDNKAFRPHLTIARIRDPRTATDLPALLEAEAAFDAGDFEVAAVSLFSSRLTPKGPIYKRLRECPFQCP